MKPYNDCMEVREDFSAYLDGEMSNEARAPLEAHLAICADCLRELDTLKRVDDSYRKLDHVAAPEGFEAGVRDAVRSGGMPSAPGQRPVPRWMGPIVAMASAAAVLIVGVLVINQRQPPTAEIQVASAGAAVQDSVASLADAATAPARRESDTASADPQPGTAWDKFARAPGSEPTPSKSDAAWKDFVKSPTATGATSAGAGREDSSEVLAQGLAVADEKAKDQLAATGRVAEKQSTDTEARARAKVIGTPPLEAPMPQAAATPEKVIDAPVLKNAPKAAVGPGEVLSRQTLRSFHIGADGIWYESGYDSQPRTALKRESPALRELMKAHNNEDWTKLLGHEARMVFEVDGAWYDLDAPPQETK